MHTRWFETCSLALPCLAMCKLAEGLPFTEHDRPAEQDGPGCMTSSVQEREKQKETEMCRL